MFALGKRENYFYYQFLNLQLSGQLWNGSEIDVDTTASQSHTFERRLISWNPVLNGSHSQTKVDINMKPTPHKDAKRITNIWALPLLLFLSEYRALAGLNLLAQLSDRIHDCTALNSVHVKKLG